MGAGLKKKEKRKAALTRDNGLILLVRFIRCFQTPVSRKPLFVETQRKERTFSEKNAKFFPNTSGGERQVLPGECSRKGARRSTRAHNRRQQVKVATISAGALAPAKSAQCLPLVPYHKSNSKNSQHLLVPSSIKFWGCSVPILINRLQKVKLEIGTVPASKFK